jgi:hypothetical protein
MFLLLFFFLARNLAGVSVKEQKKLIKYTSIKKKKKEGKKQWKIYDHENP